MPFQEGFCINSHILPYFVYINVIPYIPKQAMEFLIFIKVKNQRVKFIQIIQLYRLSS
jgi:hypothetical protein